MTSMPNRIVLASTAVLIKEPKLIGEVYNFLENFYENYFGGSKEIKIADLLETLNSDFDNVVTKKIMKYATNLDDPLIKEIMKEGSEFFSIYNDLDFDESILISLNGNSLQIPIKADEISDKLEELISIELRERGERLSELAKEYADIVDVARSVLAYSFIERKLLVSIDENLSNLLSISTFEFPQISK
jgi:predicted mannosyl-3-phosphoglycerate phosphatase (HAD superfamily)